MAAVVELSADPSLTALLVSPLASDEWQDVFDQVKWKVHRCTNLQGAVEKLASLAVTVDLLLLDVRPHPDVEALGLPFVRAWPDSTVPIVVVCDRENISFGHSCVRNGAANCLTAPLTARTCESLQYAQRHHNAAVVDVGEDSLGEEHFEFVSALGRGSQGRVDLARRRADGLLVAIKRIELPAGGGSHGEVENALRETKLLKTVTHPNITRYYCSYVRAETTGTVLSLVMEYVDGGSLKEIVDEKVKKNERIPENLVLQWFGQLVVAIRYLHSLNVLHRDLKLANIFLSKSGIVKVGDFGISRSINSGCYAQTTCGTPENMSPEVCLNKPYGKPNDIWALGCVLYELLSLRAPFAGSLASMMSRIVKGQYAPLPPYCSSDMHLLIKLMLLKNPEIRPPIQPIFEFPAVAAAIAEMNAVIGAMHHRATSDACSLSIAIEENPFLALPEHHSPTATESSSSIDDGPMRSPTSGAVLRTTLDAEDVLASTSPRKPPPRAPPRAPSGGGAVSGEEGSDSAEDALPVTVDTSAASGFSRPLPLPERRPLTRAQSVPERPQSSMLAIEVQGESDRLAARDFLPQSAPGRSPMFALGFDGKSVAAAAASIAASVAAGASVSPSLVDRRPMPPQIVAPRGSVDLSDLRDEAYPMSPRMEATTPTSSTFNLTRRGSASAKAWGPTSPSVRYRPLASPMADDPDRSPSYPTFTTGPGVGYKGMQMRGRSSSMNSSPQFQPRSAVAASVSSPRSVSYEGPSDAAAAVMLNPYSSPAQRSRTQSDPSKFQSGVAFWSPAMSGEAFSGGGGGGLSTGSSPLPGLDSIPESQPVLDSTPTSGGVAASMIPRRASIQRNRRIHENAVVQHAYNMPVALAPLDADAIRAAAPGDEPSPALSLLEMGPSVTLAVNTHVTLQHVPSGSTLSPVAAPVFGSGNDSPTRVAGTVRSPPSNAAVEAVVSPTLSRRQLQPSQGSTAAAAATLENSNFSPRLPPRPVPSKRHSTGSGLVATPLESSQPGLRTAHSFKLSSNASPETPLVDSSTSPPDSLAPARSPSFSNGTLPPPPTLAAASALPMIDTAAQCSVVHVPFHSASPGSDVGSKYSPMFAAALAAGTTTLPPLLATSSPLARGMSVKSVSAPVLSLGAPAIATSVSLRDAVRRVSTASTPDGTGSHVFSNGISSMLLDFSIADLGDHMSVRLSPGSKFGVPEDSPPMRPRRGLNKVALPTLEAQAEHIREGLLPKIRNHGVSLFGLLGSQHKNCVTGTELVDAVMAATKSDRESALHTVSLLLATDLLRNVNNWEPARARSDSEGDEEQPSSSREGSFGESADGSGRRRSEYEIPSNSNLTSLRKPSASTSSTSSSGNPSHAAAASEDALPAFTGASGALYRFLKDEPIRPWNMCRVWILASRPALPLSAALRDASRELRALQAYVGMPGFCEYVGWETSKCGAGGSAAAGGGDINLKPVPAHAAPDFRAAVAKIVMFEQFVRELQRVRLSKLKRKQRLAFFLNVYNTMVEHGILRHGTPLNRADLQAFREAVVYRIGKHDYSLDAIYHVVFRANERPVEAWAARAGRGDPRCLVNNKPDPRAVLLRTDAVLPLLPADAVDTFLTGNVNKHLDDAVAKFCATAVQVDARAGKLCLPRVFQESWNAYGSSDAAVVRWLQPYLPLLQDRALGDWKVVWPDNAR